MPPLCHATPVSSDLHLLQGQLPLFCFAHAAFHPWEGAHLRPTCWQAAATVAHQTPQVLS